MKISSIKFQNVASAVAEAVFTYSAQINAEQSSMSADDKAMAKQAIALCANGSVNDYKRIGIAMWIAEYISESVCSTYSLRCEDDNIIIEVPDYPLDGEEESFLQGELRVFKDLAEVSFCYDFGCIDEEHNVLRVTLW